MRIGREEPREGCPTLGVLSGSLLYPSVSPIDEHVASCAPCAKERRELSAVGDLLRLHSHEILAPDRGSVREALQGGDTPLAGNWTRRGLDLSRQSIRAVAMAALLALGLSALLVRGVAPIATSSGGYWRGPPIGMVQASASWNAGQSAMEINWQPIVAAQIYLVRVWQADGALVEQTQTRGLSVAFSGDRMGNAPGPLLWSVEVWVDGRKIATSTLREITRGNGD